MSETERELDWSEKIGKPAYDSIANMVAALNCDYDRLEELRESRADLEGTDEARQRIEEDALSIEVRSGWTTPGEKMEAEEFCILLTTGGPAVRIVGDLDEHGEPYRARLEVQDWFKPWTEYVPADHNTLLAYAQCFCFAC